jgi:cyclophilin family peptidyl-prolyl cis-trans isomerase
MKTSRWIPLSLATLLLLGCGGGGGEDPLLGGNRGNDTPPQPPSIQGTNLFYGLTATFYVGVTTLNPGITMGVDKCSNLTQGNSTATALTYTCKITGTGVLSFIAKDSTGKVLATQTFNIPEPQVQMATSMGTVVFELYPAKAPISVDNFLKYVSNNFYTGTLFHRVIPGFVAQAGGFNSGLKEKTPTEKPISLEVNTGLSNTTGTLAMARAEALNSATSQFYINLADNVQLDTLSGGYAVFGKVTTGIDVINAIGVVPTASNGGMSDVPVTEVIITSMKRTK